MKRPYLRLLLLFAVVQCAPGCSEAVVPVETAPFILPRDIGPIVVLVDHLPDKQNFVESRAEQVAIGLRHFAAQTSWHYVDTAPIEKVATAAAVVYLGINGNAPV